MHSAIGTLHGPQARARQPLRGGGDRWRWTLVLLLVSLAHLSIWHLTRPSQERSAARVARTMTAMLVVPPPQPAQVAAVIPEPPPAPRPEPVARPVAKAAPIPKQTPPPQRPPSPAAPEVAAPLPPEGAAAATPVAPVAPTPTILEAPRFDVAYLANQPPAYPLAARRRGIEGRVLLRAQISAQGTCLQARVERGSGSELLDRAALEAVKKWRFVPARRGDEAQVAWVEIPISFRLDNP
jgi:periplasmic protein TonB